MALSRNVCRNPVEAAVDLLSDLATAPPNGVHRFLAELSRRGATQVTANFDSCLEDAGARDVLHFHESLAFDPAGVALGATLVRIERGPPQATCAQLDRRLFRAEMVVFVGYSGSDFFDVDPCLLTLDVGRRLRWRRWQQ